MRHWLAWSLLLFTWAWAGSLPAQVSDISSTAFPVLTVGTSARAVGMGESFTAVSDDLSAMRYNPAGLALLEAPQLSLSHNSYLDGGFFDTAAFALPLGPSSGTLAIGLNYLNYGNVDQRDSMGVLRGTFTPYDLGAVGAYGFSLEKGLSLGFGSRWIRQEIDGTVHTGLLMDAALLAVLSNGFSAGINLENLGVDSGGYPLPTQLWIGTAYRLCLAPEDKQTLLFSISGGLGFQSVSRLNLGFEYGLEKRFFIRGGYSQGLDQDPTGSIKGLDFGAGVRAGSFQFDYSLSLLGDLGNVNRFSLSVFLPGVDKKSRESAAAGNQPGYSTGSALFLPPVNQPSKPVLLKFKVNPEQDQTAPQLFERAEEKLRLGLKEEALDLYLRAVEKDPGFQKAWMSLGKLYFDKSLESYRKVLEMDPKNDRLREWLRHFKP